MVGIEDSLVKLKHAAMPAWRHRIFQVVQGEKFEAKSGQTPADLLRHALRRERRAEKRLFVRFFTRTIILSGSNRVLNGHLTLSGSAK
jgi:hypothetical protein